jgi:hypothetical protein
LRQTIEALEKEVATLKQKRKQVSSHLTLGELPSAERFQQFSRAKKALGGHDQNGGGSGRNRLGHVLAPTMARTDDARAYRARYLSQRPIVARMKPPEPSP